MHEADISCNPVFRPVFDFRRCFVGLTINEELVANRTSYSSLGGVLVKCCIVQMPQFWDYIQIPKLTCRNSDSKHINVLRESMKNNPQINVGAISISPEFSSEYGVHITVIDSVHSFHAIMELRKEGILKTLLLQ